MAIIRRAATACRRCPRARLQSQVHADGRAVQRRRSGRAGAIADEFLRLQRDIGKTIIMVTHDIDEALKLGDQVAVLRTGGILAQIASPQDLLANPADAFVADFIGRDRGYRALGFAAAGIPAAAAREPDRPGRRARPGGQLRRRRLGAGGRQRPAARRAGWRSAIRSPPAGRAGDSRAAEPRRHAGLRVRHTARSPGRGAVIAQRPRRRRDARRPIRGHRSPPPRCWTGSMHQAQVVRGTGPPIRGRRRWQQPDRPTPRSAAAGGRRTRRGGRATSGRSGTTSASNQHQVLVWLGYHTWLSALPLADWADHLVAAGLVGPALPLAVPADGQHRRPALHHSVAGAVHPVARHPEDQDPGSEQRGGRVDHLHRRAAGPGGRGRAGLSARRRSCRPRPRWAIAVRRGW